MLLWHTCQVAALALLGRAAFSNQVRIFLILTASTATEYALDADEQMVKAAIIHATWAAECMIWMFGTSVCADCSANALATPVRAAGLPGIRF